MLLDFGAPGKVRLPAGQEHGRTIPLPDIRGEPCFVEFTSMKDMVTGMTFSFHFDARRPSGEPELR